MNFKKTLAGVAVGFLVAVGLAATPTAAFAQERPAPTVTQQSKWVLPNGGTSTNVTWPQVAFDQFDFGTVPCGETVTIQVDNNRYDTPEEIAKVDSLDDDGLLYNGEDTSVYYTHSWETFTAEPCIELVTVKAQAPIVVQPTCDQGGSISLLPSDGVRWENPEGANNFNLPSLELTDVVPGEYTFRASNEEGNYEPYLESFVVTIAGAENCANPTPTPTPEPTPTETVTPEPTPEPTPTGTVTPVTPQPEESSPALSTASQPLDELPKTGGEWNSVPWLVGGAFAVALGTLAIIFTMKRRRPVE